MTSPQRGFADFEQLRKEVSAIMAGVADCLRQLDANERSTSLLRSREALNNDTFKVLIVGEFKRGKSTSINAMLGAQVLPSKVAPCTAVLTRVKWGPKPRAILKPRAGGDPVVVDLIANPKALLDYLVINDELTRLVKENWKVFCSVRSPAELASARTNAHLKNGQLLHKYNDKLLWEAIQKRALSGSDAEEDADASSSPWSLAVVEYPLDLLRNNVELIDSPGLNEHASRSAVTKSYFANADAMILVLSCTAFFAQSERQFLDTDLADRDLRDVFFLYNRFDAVKDEPADLADLKRIAQKYLSSRVKGEPRQFFVTASEALIARIDGDVARLEESQFPKFTEALEDFLATDRGRVKLNTPIRSCEHAIQEAVLHLIPHRDNLLRLPLEQLRKTLEEQRPRLEESQRQCDQVLRIIDRRSESLIREVKASYRTHLAELEAGLPRQARSIDISVWDAIRSRNETKRKVANAIDEWIAARTREWEQQQLRPVLETHCRAMAEELDDQVVEFQQNMDKLRAAFAPKAGQAITSDVDVSKTSRLLGAGLGLLSVGSMVEGAALGVGPAVRGLATNLAAAVVLGALHVSAVVVFPAILALGAFRAAAAARRTADEIRAAVTNEVAAVLRRCASETENSLGQQVLEVLQPVRTRIAEQMATALDETRGQVQAIIKEREESKAQTEEQLATLADVREKLGAYLISLQKVQTRLG